MAVRVVPSKPRPPRHEPKRFPKPPHDPQRERLLWRLVIIGAVIVVALWALTLWVTMTRTSPTDTFWASLKEQVVQVGADFSNFWRSVTGQKTARPEDEYKELEEKVFPPLPSSAAEEQQE